MLEIVTCGILVMIKLGRFTIRDLALVVLMVAIALGSRDRQRQLDWRIFADSSSWLSHGHRIAGATHLLALALIPLVVVRLRSRGWGQPSTAELTVVFLAIWELAHRAVYSMAVRQSPVLEFRLQKPIWEYVCLGILMGVGIARTAARVFQLRGNGATTLAAVARWWMVAPLLLVADILVPWRFFAERYPERNPFRIALGAAVYTTQNVVHVGLAPGLALGAWLAMASAAWTSRAEWRWFEWSVAVLATVNLIGCLAWLGHDFKQGSWHWNDATLNPIMPVCLVLLIARPIAATLSTPRSPEVQPG